MHCILHLASACANPIPALKILQNAGANFSLINNKKLTPEEQAMQRIETYSKDVQSQLRELFAEKQEKVEPIKSLEISKNVTSKNEIVEKWLTQSIDEMDSEDSRDSQTSVYDDLKTLRNDNIKVNFLFFWYYHLLLSFSFKL